MSLQDVDATQPLVVGFDLPTGSDPANKTVIAWLDSTPDRPWMDSFSQQAAEFRRRHRLDDLRLVGRTISAVGRIGDPRSLASDVKAFVHRLSRDNLRTRVTTPTAIGTEAQFFAGPANNDRARELEMIAAIPAVPTLLEAVLRSTGMRFAAIARVTDDRWTACAVYDLIDFGLKPGQDLKLETTICNEIRIRQQTIAFDRASTDPIFAQHKTPAMYGFESYISVPIRLDDGTFFGTLCALDPEPARLDKTTIRTIELFAAMIGRELTASGSSARAS